MTAVVRTHRRTDDSGSAGSVTPPRWGSVTTWPSRYGICRRRVVVLAPGTSAADAGLWRLSAEYPWVGAGLAVLGLVLAASLLGPAVGLCVVLGCYGAGFVLVSHVSAGVRHGARELLICTGMTPEPLPSASADLLFWETVARMSTADEALRDGRIDRARHELAWAAAWEELPERSHPLPF